MGNELVSIISSEETPSLKDVEFKKTDVNEVESKFLFTFTNEDDHTGETTLKEGFYVRAIRNLMKKNEFLQLYIQLAEEQISEEEYEMELINNKDKYFIEMSPIKSEQEFLFLINVIEKLPKSLSVDEFSELFGISRSALEDR